MSQALRALLHGRESPRYDAFVALCAGYVRAYVNARHSRRRFGFTEPFPDVVRGVADVVIGRLLSEEERPDRTLERPVVRKGLTRIAAAFPDGIDRETEDRVLIASFRKLLRRCADRGLIQAWMDEHPEEAGLIRAIKRHVRMDQSLAIVRDARGQWLAGHDADFRLPMLSIETLNEILRFGFSDVVTVLDAIRPYLHPCEDQGGYCYLLDLVREATRSRQAALELHPEGSGAAPSDSAPRLIRGLPFSVYQDKALQELERCTRLILQGDAEKERRRGEPVESDPSRPTAKAWMRVCAEMVLRRYELGNPNWADLRQQDLLSNLLGPVYQTDPAFHCQKTDYLIKRVRERWKLPGA